MGFWDSAKDKAKDKAVGAITWPVRKISDKATEKYLKAKGKWAGGTCPQCGKPINARNPGSVHKQCWNALKKQVAKWDTSHNSDGSSKAGVHFTNCNCNRNWAVHECKGKMGDPI